MNWLDHFKPEALIYEEGNQGALIVKLLQAARVNRLRRKILFRNAVKNGVDSRFARFYLLAKDDLPRDRVED
ncbi:MAG: hypothetical protein DRH50_16820 [Deltaproteobacteria bacterium]|nr:MAG: hypothetical protein DRH50_16820 [Deltaproteobacteria bacterium]